MGIFSDLSDYNCASACTEHVIPPTGARVMDLQHPTRKMSKSEESTGTVLILDDLKVAAKKLKRAVTGNSPHRW